MKTSFTPDPSSASLEPKGLHPETKFPRIPVKSFARFGMVRPARLLMACMFMIFSYFHASADCTVTSTINASAFLGTYGACTGIVTIPNGVDLVMDANLTIPTGVIELHILSGGQIIFPTNSITLSLGIGTAIVIDATSPTSGAGAAIQTTGPCNNTKRIRIGTVDYAACTGNGNVCVLFSQLVAAGGTIQPNPEIVVQNGANGNVCFPTFGLNATVSGFTLGTPTFAWSQLTGPGSSSYNPSNTVSNPNVTVTTSGTYTYRVAITDPGNSDCGVMVTVYADITVQVLPSPTTTIMGTTTVCQNAASPNVTFNNPQTLAIIVFYNINGGGALSVNVPAMGSTPVAVPTITAGTFIYNLDSVRYAINPVCTGIVDQSAIVTVAANPTAGSPTMSSLCIGAAVAINGNPQGGSNTYTMHSWIVSNAGTTGATNANLTNANLQTVTFSGAGLSLGTATLLYTVVDQNGCSGTKTVAVEVTTGAPDTPGPIAGSASVCPNTMGLVYSIAPVSGASSYTWTVPSGWSISNGQSTSSITVTAGDCGENGIISVTATNMGCGTSNASILVVSADDVLAPLITCPIDVLNLQGCGIADINIVTTGFVFSDLPVIVDPADFIAAGGTITEACGADHATYIDEITDMDCPNPILQVNRTWTVTDHCGNTSDACIQMIEIVNQIGPTLTGVPFPGTTNTNACLDMAAAAAPFDDIDAIQGYTDDCGGAITATLTGTDVTGDNCNWIVTYTFTVADECGNLLPGQTYANTGSDQTAPTGTAPMSVTDINACMPTQLEAEASFDAISAASGYTDNCGDNRVVATLTNALVPGDHCQWSVTYTFSVSDNCGNALENQMYTRSGGDQTAPTGTAPMSVTDINACMSTQMEAEASFDAISAASGYTDNCSDNTVVATLTNVLVAGDHCDWSVTYTFSVSDNCGNALDNQTYTRSGSDQTAPTGTTPMSVTDINACLPSQMEAEAAFDAMVAASGYTDNCSDNTVAATLTNALVAGDHCEWSVTYTFNVSDNCGNALENQTYIRSGSDQTAPTFDPGCQYNPRNIYTEDGGDCPMMATTSFAEGVPIGLTTIQVVAGTDVGFFGGCVSDNCSTEGATATPESIIIEDDLPCQRTITVHWRFRDACGNPAASLFTDVYQVFDNTAPVVVAPPTADLECNDAMPSGALTIEAFIALGGMAADNCTSQDDLVVSYVDGALVGSDCQGSIDRTYFVTDLCGNSTSVLQIFTVSDNTDPNLIDPLIGCTIFNQDDVNECYAVADQFNGATMVAAIQALYEDNCSSDVSVTFAGRNALAGDDCYWYFSYDYEISDDCGNVIECQFFREGGDATAPTFTVPSNTTIEKTAMCGYDADVAITGDVVNEADNCDQTLDATFEDVTEAGSCEGEIVITRTWTVTDECGNSATAAQIITAYDITPPVLVAPENITFECALEVPDPASDIDAFLALAGAQAIDNCSSLSHLVVTSQTSALTGMGCNGFYTRTYYITDDCGNSSSVAHQIALEDNTAPEVVTGVLESCYNSVVEAEAAAIAATIATDNCTATNQLIYTADTQPGMGCDSLITVTVTDLCGNSQSVIYEAATTCQVVFVKVYLEGSYNIAGDTMRSTLNNSRALPGQISPSPFIFDAPPGQPYAVAPWNYTGNMGTAFGDGGLIPYPNTVVDWVLVSVRENGITPAHTVWTCTGWVHRDGTVTFPESCPGPGIDIMNDYYIVVQHRNHLGIMTPGIADVLCEGNRLYWDFTTSDSYKATFRVGQKMIEPGVWAMYAGNGDQSFSIQAINSTDRTTWKLLQNFLGYSAGDYDLNAATNSVDETLWKLNQNRSTGVIFY